MNAISAYRALQKPQSSTNCTNWSFLTCFIQDFLNESVYCKKQKKNRYNIFSNPTMSSVAKRCLIAAAISNIPGDRNYLHFSTQKNVRIQFGCFCFTFPHSFLKIKRLKMPVSFEKCYFICQNEKTYCQTQYYIYYLQKKNPLYLGCRNIRIHN